MFSAQLICNTNKIQSVIINKINLKKNQNTDNQYFKKYKNTRKYSFVYLKKNKKNNCCKLVDSAKNNRLISCEYTQNIENLFFLYF